MQDRICQIDENLLHRAVLTVGRSLPVYSDHRTCSVSATTSQKCTEAEMEHYVAPALAKG